MFLRSRIRHEQQIDLRIAEEVRKQNAWAAIALPFALDEISEAAGIPRSAPNLWPRGLG